MTESKPQRKLIPLLLAALVLSLAACGSSGKSADSKASVSTAPLSGYAIGDYDKDDHDGRGSSDADNDDITGPKDRDNDSDNRSGSYYDSDDNSVRDFGRAADATDRRTIVALVTRYFAVAAAGDGASACPMIISSLAKSVPEDLGRPPGFPYFRGSTCAAVMTKVFATYHRQLAAYSAKLQVTGVRLDGDRGVAVLGFGDLPGRLIYVAHQHGVWKIAALLDNELP